MVRLVEQAKVDVGDLFIQRAQILVNGVENLVDRTWSEFDAVLDQRTRKANVALKMLIARLPSHPDEKLGGQGFIDFNTSQGQRRRIQFMRDVSKVYGSWQRGILGDLDIKRWAPGEPAWEKSLGLHDHVGGAFLLRLRDEIVRKAHQLVSLLDINEGTSEGVFSLEGKRFHSWAFYEGRLEFVPPELDEARHKRVTTTGGVVSARITGRGLPKQAQGHSRRTSIILRGLKGIISSQEKAMLENVLRGMDELPAKHANNLYDAATGLTLKSALNAIADDFSTGQINKKQLKLSIQTHIRAMIRRIAGESHLVREITGVEDFVNVPPTRKKDLKQLTQGTMDVAFTIDTGRELIRRTKGGGDSLGRHPGDKVIAVPVPSNFTMQIKRAAEAAREAYLRKHGKRR